MECWQQIVGRSRNENEKNIKERNAEGMIGGGEAKCERRFCVSCPLTRRHLEL